MISSSEAQIYLKSRQEVLPFQFTNLGENTGKIIAIVIFPDEIQDDCECIKTENEVEESNSKSPRAQTRAYICTVGSRVVEHDKKKTSHHWNSLGKSRNFQVIIRFSGSSFIPLTCKRSRTYMIGNCVDRTSEMLQGVVRNTDINHEYYVTETDIKDEAIQANIENFSRCKVQRTKYCLAQKFEPTDSGKIRGVIFSLSTKKNMDGAQNAFEYSNRIPTPLLSISLTIANAEDRMTTSEASGEQKDSPSNVLLQQCLKRLLIHNLIVCQTSTSANDEIVHDESTYRGSIVSLKVPSLKGFAESFECKVNHVIPHWKRTSQSRSTSRFNSNIFIILPSTRITLIHSNEETREVPARTPSPLTLMPKPKKSDATEDLILLTINSIRHFSLLASKQKGGFPHSVDIPRAFLLSGPPGVGKTHAVRMAVKATNIHAKKGQTITRLISMRGSDILAVGASEADAALELERIVISAVEFASKSPKNISLIFMDECDALLSSAVAGAILATLLDRMTLPLCKEYESYSHIDPAGWKRLVIVAATNRIDAIPSTLRRPGRFDRELCISPPNKEMRYKILKSLLSGLDQDEKNSISDCLTEEELTEIADLCVGYVAADLSSLIRRAAFLSIKEGSITINQNLLRDAMKDVGASALRDSAINAPPTTRWDDIAGDAGGAKTALRRAVEWPLTKKDDFKRMGLSPPRGILLHGPPGCAKTTLARAAAGAAGVAFLSLSPADVYASSYVGEAEAVVRRAFNLARSASPCILFFDEIDSIVAASSSNKSGMDRGNNAEARVLSTFLNEMDGVDGSISDGVLVLGATNRPSTMDSALLRPGRFDKVIYVPNPDEEGRRSILEAQCQAWDRNGASSNIDVDLLAKDCITGMMTGAEIVGACREAAIYAIREALNSEEEKNKILPKVHQHHLERALGAVKPLLSNPKVLSEYTIFEDEHSK